MRQRPYWRRPRDWGARGGARQILIRATRADAADSSDAHWTFSQRDNNRKPGDARWRARSLARGALIPRHNRRKPGCLYLDNEYNSAKSDGFELDEDPPTRRQVECEEHCVKANISPFNGNLSIKEFMDWLSEVERFFDLIEILPNKMVKLAAYRLKNGAAVWWDQVQRSRTREGRELVQS